MVGKVYKVKRYVKTMEKRSDMEGRKIKVFYTDDINTNRCKSGIVLSWDDQFLIIKGELKTEGIKCASITRFEVIEE